jgi:hypothetical protein
MLFDLAVVSVSFQLSGTLNSLFGISFVVTDSQEGGREGCGQAGLSIPFLGFLLL